MASMDSLLSHQGAVGIPELDVPASGGRVVGLSFLLCKGNIENFVCVTFGLGDL
jgi:hypothetical protein